MENMVQVFSFEENEVRTLLIEDEVWFVGKDVATILGYGKTQNAISAHVDDEDKTTALIQGTGSNYKSKTVLINESGVYSLVMSSKLPTAKKFKRWVTSEVLPSIRKTGGYHLEKPDSYMISDPIERAKRWIEEEEVRLALEMENKVLLPKAEGYDVFLDTNGLFNFTDAANLLGVKRSELMNWLEYEKDYIYRKKDRNRTPMARAHLLDKKENKRKWFDVKVIDRTKNIEQTFITAQGLEAFRKMLKKEGLLASNTYIL